MTISIKVSVNGSYRATVKHSVDGVDQGGTVIEGKAGGGPVERSINFRHGAENTFVITEEQMPAGQSAA